MAAPSCPLPPNHTPATTSAISLALSQLSSSSSTSSTSAETPTSPPVDEPESPKTPQAGQDGKLREDVWDEAQSLGATGVEESEEERAANPSRSDVAWPRMLASAVDHPDDHFAKVCTVSLLRAHEDEKLTKGEQQVIRSLSFAAANFGHSPKGLYHSALPGTELMDGSIFVRGSSSLLPLSPSSLTFSLTSRRTDLPLPRLGSRRRIPRQLGSLSTRLRRSMGGRAPSARLLRGQGQRQGQRTRSFGNRNRGDVPQLSCPISSISLGSSFPR